jgi:hypothetical protein
MSKRLTFTSVAQVRTHAQARFPADVAFSRMTATEKAYANVYGMTILNPTPTLAQLKESLQAGRKTVQSATREKIYNFIAERIEPATDDPKTTLVAVRQELTHILEQLQTMTPLAPSDASMDDSEHEQWMSQHTEIGLLVDQAHNIALWLVPQEVQTLLKQIDERRIALYPVVDTELSAELSAEENALYEQAKSNEL